MYHKHWKMRYFGLNAIPMLSIKLKIELLEKKQHELTKKGETTFTCRDNNMYYF